MKCYPMISLRSELHKSLFEIKLTRYFQKTITHIASRSLLACHRSRVPVKMGGANPGDTINNFLEMPRRINYAS